MARTATIVRETSESKVELSLNLDGTGKTDIDTSVPFYNHMMTALGKHSLIDLTIHAHGDTDIDVYFSDTAAALGFGKINVRADISGRFALTDRKNYLGSRIFRDALNLVHYISDVSRPVGRHINDVILARVRRGEYTVNDVALRFRRAAVIFVNLGRRLKRSAILVDRLAFIKRIRPCRARRSASYRNRDRLP